MTTAIITDLIPQRPPFVMIDALVESDNLHAISALVIRDDNVLVHEGRFTESGLVENIAQTAAAGLHDAGGTVEGAAPTVGYIGSIKNLLIHHLPAVGNTLLTEVFFIQEVLGARIVHGRVRLDGSVIAECELRIFIQEA